MSRVTRLVVASLLCMTVAVVSATAPAWGQLDSDELSRLESLRDELAVRIAEFDAGIDALTATIDGLDDELRRSEVEFELVADEIERVVDLRREPETTRVEIAIAGFMKGDPRGNALLDELASLQGTSVAARRRQFYDAVIDNATQRLARIDDQLRALDAEVDRVRSRTDGLAARRDEATTSREALGVERTAAALELDETVARIDLLRTLENRAVLTGLPVFNDPNRPVLAVKIDNSDAARPQAGLNVADVVWEEEVEGAITRLVLAFHSDGAEVVGPIRSMRTTDVDLLAQLNRPLFVNSGGNRITTAAVAGSTLVNIGAAVRPEGYYRDGSRRAPHNLMANAFNLWSIGAGEGAGTPIPLWGFRDPQAPLPEGARPVTGVTIEFGNATIDYTWNGSGWARSQNGRPHVDSGGVQVAPTNVIVQFTIYGVSPADAASPEAITLGTNPAWILMDGSLVEGFWRRDELDDPVTFVDLQGRPIDLEPGRTWIELARADTVVLR
ncbi:MAG: DUF3048 domain-containing protein [Acidimicrobiales bacterium]